MKFWLTLNTFYSTSGISVGLIFYEWNSPIVMRTVCPFVLNFIDPLKTVGATITTYGIEVGLGVVLQIPGKSHRHCLFILYFIKYNEVFGHKIANHASVSCVERIGSKLMFWGQLTTNTVQLQLNTILGLKLLFHSKGFTTWSVFVRWSFLWPVSSDHTTNIPLILPNVFNSYLFNCTVAS